MPKSTPLGPMSQMKDPDGGLWLYGHLSEDGRPNLSVPDDVDINIMADPYPSKEDFSFITSVLSDLENYISEAEDYLQVIYHHAPELLGGRVDADQPTVTYPNLIFYSGETNWNIRFAEGDYRICDPYGVMVTFSGNEILKFEDLSDAEEMDED